MTRFVFVTLAILLAACAKTVSHTPRISAQELAEEQRAQAEIVKATKKSQKASATPEQMLARLKQVGLSVGMAGQTMCEETGIPRSACNFPFVIDPKGKEVNAYTDGKQIVINRAMMDFAESDTDLATVLSHELAHAIMSHPDKTRQNAALGGLLGTAVDVLARSQGFDTGGAFGDLGMQGGVLRYSQDFETEADYIGMYILERSGYDIHQAANLWRRMAALNPDGIYVGSTHPTSAQRYLLLNKTAKEIDAKKQARLPLLPEKRPEEG